MWPKENGRQLNLPLSGQHANLQYHGLISSHETTFHFQHRYRVSRLRRKGMSTKVQVGNQETVAAALRRLRKKISQNNVTLHRYQRPGSRTYVKPSELKRKKRYVKAVKSRYHRMMSRSLIRELERKKKEKKARGSPS